MARFIVQVLNSVLAMLCEAKPALACMAAREEQGEEEEKESKEEGKMLGTLVQRLQFVLLSLVKLDTAKKGKVKKRENLKELYALALKCSTGEVLENQARKILDLLAKLE